MSKYSSIKPISLSDQKKKRRTAYSDIKPLGIEVSMMVNPPEVERPQPFYKSSESSTKKGTTVAGRDYNLLNQHNKMVGNLTQADNMIRSSYSDTAQAALDKLKQVKAGAQRRSRDTDAYDIAIKSLQNLDNAEKAYDKAREYQAARYASPEDLQKKIDGQGYDLGNVDEVAFLLGAGTDTRDAAEWFVKYRSGNGWHDEENEKKYRALLTTIEQNHTAAANGKKSIRAAQDTITNPDGTKTNLGDLLITRIAENRQADINASPEEARNILAELNKGNYDAINSRAVSLDELSRAGWKASGDTVNYTQAYSDDNGRAAVFSPVVFNQQGEVQRVLTPLELEQYAMNVLDGGEDSYNLQVSNIYQGYYASDLANENADRIRRLSERYYNNTDIEGVINPEIDLDNVRDVTSALGAGSDTGEAAEWFVKYRSGAIWHDEENEKKYQALLATIQQNQDTAKRVKAEYITHDNTSEGAAAQAQLSGMGVDLGEYDAFRKMQERRETVTRKAQEYAEWSAQNAGTGALATVGNILAAPFKAVEYAGNVIGGMIDEYKAGGNKLSVYNLPDTYDDYLTKLTSSSTQSITNGIRESIRGDGDNAFLNALGEIAANTYGGVTSSIQSYLTILACEAFLPPGMAEGLSLAIMSGEAANDAYHDVIDRGGTIGQATTYSMMAGVNEALGEKISLDHIISIEAALGKKKAKTLLMNMFKQMFVEGSEELFTETLNEFADRAINADKSEYEQAVKEYLAQGMSEEEAKKKASGDFLGRLWWSFYGGMIGGGLGGAGKVLLNTASTGAQAVKSAVQERIATNQYVKQNAPKIAEKEGGAESVMRSASDILSDKNAVDTKALQKAFDKAQKTVDTEEYSKNVARVAAEVQKYQLREYAQAEPKAVEAAISDKLKELVPSGTDVSPMVNVVKSMIGASDDTLTSLEKKAYRENAEIIDKAVEEFQRDEGIDFLMVKAYVAKKAVADRIRETNLNSGVTQEESYDTDIFDANDNGKTYLKGKDMPVEIAKITDISDKDMTVELKDGRKVQASEISFGDKDAATVLGSLVAIQNDFSDSVKMPTGFINAVYHAYNAGNFRNNLSAFIDDVTEIYASVNTNMKYTPVLLSREMAETLCREAEKGKTEAIGKKQKAVERKKTAARREGTVVYEDNIDPKKLKGRRKVGVEVVENLAKATGITFHFYESTKETRANTPNGYYKNGEIWIDINAGRNGEGLILFTVSHELTHFMRDYSPEKFDSYAKFLFANYADKNLTLRKAVHAEMLQNTSLTYDEAYEEVVARLSESFLIDAHLSEKSAELYKADKTVWEAVRDTLRDITARVKRFFGKLSPDNELGRIGHEMVQKNEEILDRFILGIQSASEKYSDFKGSNDEEVRYDNRVSDDDAIKVQLLENTDRLNATEIVADVNVPQRFEGKRQAKEWAVNLLKSSGYIVDRQGFGRIDFNEKLINKAFNYLNTNEEYAAFACLPRVLKRGIAISGHGNHKSRGFETVTIGAAVRINSKRVNMAVVIKVDKGTNKYRVHRVLTPYGTKVLFNEKTEPTPSGAVKGTVTPTIGSVFNDSISYAEGKIKSEFADENTKYSLREEAPPKNTIIGYKVFRVKDGKLYPPMVANPGGQDTPVGVWLNADIGERAPDSKTGRAQVKGKGGMSLSFRPGWYLGDIPRASQFDRMNPKTGVKDMFPADFVWAECDCAADVDYQKEAMSYGYTDKGKFRHAYAGLPRIPENGYYKYRTNPRPDTVPWIITGAIKVNRLLSDAEVAEILRKNGVTPPQRQGGNKTLEELGLNNDHVMNQSRGDLFEDDDLFTEDSTVENIFARHYTTHAAEIGEVLRNTADIAIAPNTVKNIISRVIRENLGKVDERTKRELTVRLMAELESAKTADPETIVDNMIAAVRDVVQDMNVTDETAVEQYEQLKSAFSGKYYLTDEQIADLKENDYTLGKFKNEMFGKLNIVSREKARRSVNGGYADASALSLEDVFDQLTDSYAEQIFGISRDEWNGYDYHAPMMLKEAFDNLSAAREIAFSQVADEEDMDNIAVTIASQFTGAVVQQKYNSRHNPYVKELVDQFERRKKEAVKKRNDYYKERMKEIRSKRDQKIADMQKGYQEQREREHDRRKRTELRGMVRRLAESFNKRLTKPKQGQYIPRELISQTVDILNAIDLDTRRSERLTEKIKALYGTYEGLKTDAEAYAVYDPVVSEIIKGLSENVGDTPIMNMSVRQLGIVYQALRSLDEVIRNSVKMVDTEFKQTAHELGREWISEIVQVKAHKRNLFSDLTYSQLRPDVMFNRIVGWKKNSVSSQLAQMLDDGQLTMTQLEMEFTMGFEDLLEDYENLRSLSDTKKLVDVGLKDENDKPVLITRGMMLSLYMHLLNEDNVRHIEGGGLTVPDMKEYYKGDMSAAYGMGQSSARPQLDTTRYIAGIKSAIAEQLTSYEKEWIKAAQKFFDEDSKNALNETTMKMYHFKKATVNNYFPIHTDPDYRAAAFEDIQRNMALENSGFMKERVHATNPILLEDITDVIHHQIQKVSQYCGMTIAIKNFEKVYGTTTLGFGTSVQKALKKKYSGAATSHIDNLITDLTSGRKVSDKLTRFNNAFGKARGNLAQATLTLNPSVAFSQAASYPTAAAVIGWKPLMKALVKGGRNNHPFSRADKTAIADVSPLLWKRLQGYSSVEMGDLKNKRLSKHKVMNKLRKALGWIEFFDGATVGRLYYACEYYVDENYKDLQKGSDEYKAKVAEWYNRVIEHTQPNYTVMQRPDILRNPNELVKSLTMFMTQRLQNFNIIYDAAGEHSKMLHDLKHGLNGVTATDVKQARLKLWRAITSQLVASMTITVFKTLASFALYSLGRYRDDDEELTYGSFGLGLLDMFADTILGNVVLGSDLYSLFKNKVWNTPYYGLSMSGIDSFRDLLENFGKLDFSDLSLDDIKKVAFSMAQLFGIPAKNAEKIGLALYYYGKDISERTLGDYEQNVERTSAQNIHRIELNLLNGDTEKAQDIFDAILQEQIDKNTAKGKNKDEAEKDARSTLRNRFTSTYKERYLSAWGG